MLPKQRFTHLAAAFDVGEKLSAMIIMEITGLMPIRTSAASNPNLGLEAVSIECVLTDKTAKQVVPRNPVAFYGATQS